LAFQLKQPLSKDEFERYYELRWRVLRAPWNEAKGSEADDIEENCFHIMVTDANKVIGVGRLQYNSANEAQIRYMAVDDDYEGNGIGSSIVNALEQEAARTKHKLIMLDAREPAVGFYEKLGYQVKQKSYVLFDSIQHYQMIKHL
jgi:predicted GNAT family N-acyltransferase